MDLTVGILSYNTSALTVRCLESIYKKTKNIKFEVILVDNASRDNTVEVIKKKFQKIILIENKKNNFFAKGYNQAIKKSKGKYFLMLNSDAYIQDNSFFKLLKFMESKKVYACEGLEISESGKIIKTGSKFPSPLIDFFELSIIGRRIASKKMIDKFRMKSNDRKKNFEVDVGCNAFFCMRTDFLKELMYDEKFKLYYTENDLCKRFKKMTGNKIYHCGNSYVIHKMSASTEKLGEERISIYYSDMFHYYLKNKRIDGLILYLLLKAEQKILKLRSVF